MTTFKTLDEFATVSLDMFANVDDDLSKYQDLPKDLAKAVQNAAAKKKEVQMTKIADQVVEMLSNADSEISNLVNNIRTVRRTEKTLLAKVKKITKAKEVSMKTGNFVPLLASLYGISIFRTNDNHKKLQEQIDALMKE